MEGRIAAVVDGGPCSVGVESTVVDLSGGRPRLLRPGGVTLPMLEEVAGPVEVDAAVTGRLREGERAASPGMKYKHYAPKARVILVKGSPEAYARFLAARAAEEPDGLAALCFDGEAQGLSLPAVAYGGRRITPPRPGRCSTRCAGWMKSAPKKSTPPVPRRMASG